MRHALSAAALAALCITSLAAQASPELSALRRAFRRAKDPATLQEARSEALDHAVVLDDAAVANALVKAYERLESECAPIIKERHEILLKDKGRKLDELRSQLQPLRDLQRRVLTNLRALKTREAQAALAQRLVRKRLPMRLRRDVARVAIAAMDPSKIGAAPRQKLNQLLPLLEAIEGLGRSGDSFGGFVLAALGRKEPIAKAQAIDALAAICWPGGLQPLVDFLETEKDHELRQRAGNALCVLTRQKLGASHVSWSAWLRERGAPFLRGERRLGGGKPDASERKAQGYYFGMPLDRSSILFVHDNSLSMRAQLGDKKRIERSVDELCKALDSLEPTQRFNIVLLANRVWAFDEKQLPATKRNVDRAKTWLRYQPIELGTNIYNALDAAFVLAGRGVRDRYYEPRIDTIYLLSDGAPTRHLGGRGGAGRGGAGRGQGRGGGQPGRGGGGPGGAGPGGAGPGGAPREKPADILDAVRHWNLFDRIEIHTIFLGNERPGAGGRRGGRRAGGGRGQGRGGQGRGPGRRGGGAGRFGGGQRGAGFMRALARQNRGQYKHVK